MVSRHPHAEVRQNVKPKIEPKVKEFERPWRTKSPDEGPFLVHRLRDLAKDRPLVIAMESTGTYGDALRQALTDAGLVVHRVSGKAVHDYAEIFDGVPSQHDGKDAGSRA